jgi:AcrR family transcriptional regulator
MGTKDRKAREKESLRQDILDAARELFVREGYESVSMRKIADKVEYSPGTLYLHFRDKAEILDCLCQETFSKLNTRMQAIHQDSGDSLEGLRRGLLTYVQFGLDNPSHYTITFIQGLKNREGPADQGHACFGRLLDIVRRCIEEGRIESRDVDETAQALWAGVHGITSLLIVHGGKFPFVEQTRLVERVVGILIQGVQH